MNVQETVRNLDNRGGSHVGCKWTTGVRTVDTISYRDAHSRRDSGEKLIKGVPLGPEPRMQNASRKIEDSFERATAWYWCGGVNADGD